MNTQNSHLPASRTCILWVFLLSIGCNSIYRQSLQRAEQAVARGELMTAARFYREACLASPDDKLACGQAPIFAQKAAAQAAERARPACDAGDLDRCMPPLLEAQEMADHPEVTALIEKASLLHAKRCAEWKMDGPLNMAVAGLACLQSRGHQFAVPRYHALIKESASQLASRFVELAVAAEDQASSGAASVLWNTAQCLSPGADKNWRAQQARQDFLDSSGIPVIIYVGGTMPPETASTLSNLCQRISSRLPAWAQCTKISMEAGQREVLHLQVDAVIQDVRTNTSRESRSVDYPSATLLIPNPDYASAQKQLQSAEEAFQQADKLRQQVSQQTSSACGDTRSLSLLKCDGCPLSPEKKAFCAQATEANYQRKLKERDAAKDKLHETPEKVEKIVNSTFGYMELTHSWTSDFHFTIKTNTPGIKIPLRKQGGLSYEDKEHPGHKEAKVEEDPLEPPSNSFFADAFLAELTPQVIEAVQADGAVRGAARQAQCKELAAGWGTSWVQCWAEASLWGSGNVPPEDKFLQLLASSAGVSELVHCR